MMHGRGESDSEGGAIRCGVGGAKGGGQGECEPAKHGPDSEPGNRGTGAGAHTARRENTAKRRHTPEVGAVCLNRARTDLCGGRAVMRVPTAKSQQRCRTSDASVRALGHELRAFPVGDAGLQPELLVAAVPPGRSGEDRRSKTYDLGHGASALSVCGDQDLAATNRKRRRAVAKVVCFRSSVFAASARWNSSNQQFRL